MDFGVARIAGAPTLTAAGEVVGTLAYMSPEQAEGLIAGPESDVYSLALTLYECWAGINPVAAPTPAETARRIGEPVPSLRDFRPDLPEGLVDEIDACLEPEPEFRPTALELRECLEQELDSLSELPIPGSESPAAHHRREWLGAGRVAALCALCLVLILIGGPLGGPGAALLLAVLCLPSLLMGAPAAGLAPPVAPLLAAAGVPSAAAALGAAAPSRIGAALLGAGAWAWMLAGSIALGLGPDLGIAERAPDGWATDTSLAADAVLAPLFHPESLAGFAIFALAGVALGALLRLRHASVALLGAMLWAAAVNAGLAAIGDGGLGAAPFGVVVAAAIAVAVEFAIRRGGLAAWRGPRGANGSDPLTT
jgi:serine/threonine-protein kinase